MHTPKVKPKEICSVCGEGPKVFAHTGKFTATHKYKPRLETTEEAYYRQGYADGSRYTADKIHWGPGWD